MDSQYSPFSHITLSKMILKSNYDSPSQCLRPVLFLKLSDTNTQCLILLTVLFVQTLFKLISPLEFHFPSLKNTDRFSLYRVTCYFKTVKR